MKQILNSKFIILKKLGKGTFSNVYKVQKISTKKFYALKRIVTKKLNQKELSSALNEIRILASFQSSFIVGFKEAFIDQDTKDLCIIMDYCNGGDLKCQIKKMAEKNERFSEKKIIKFFFQLTQALELLHRNCIVHRDIKSANVMIDKKLNNVKIGDMNVSTIVKSIFAYTQTGTPFYASPEVWREDPYNYKADIWSLGCLMFEICMYKTPFQADNINKLNEKIQKRQMEKFDNYYSKELQQCILKLLNVNQHLRPTSEEILQFKIFEQYDKIYQQNDSLLDTIRSNSRVLSLGYDFPECQYSDEEILNEKELIINFKKQSIQKKTSLSRKYLKNTSIQKLISKQKTDSTKESLDDLNTYRKQKILNIGGQRKTKNKKQKSYLSHILPRYRKKNNLTQQIDNLKYKAMNNSNRIHNILQSNYQHRCTSQKLILKQNFLNKKNNSNKYKANKIDSHISYLNYDLHNQNTKFSKQRSLSKNRPSYKYNSRKNQQYITYDKRNQIIIHKEQKEKIDLIKKLISQKNIELKRKCSNQNLNSKKVKDLVQFLKKNQIQNQHYVFNQILNQIFLIFYFFVSSIHKQPYLSSPTLKIILLSYSEISTKFINSL